MSGPFGTIEDTCEYNDDGYKACSGDSNGVETSFESVVDGELPDAPPTSDEVAPNGLQRLAPPSAGDVARALADPALHAKLAACRADYGIDVASVSARITVAPSGAVAKVALATDNDALGACIAHTLHQVTLTAYRGGAVAFDETVTL